VEVPRFTADHFQSAAKSVLHARKHASEFGLTTEADYVRAAAQFLDRAQQSAVPARVDPDGIVRLYDATTNTFASYDSTSGIILTFFKPTSRTYWERHEADWGTPVMWR
jgi:pyocin large subunit-like protein